MFFFYCIFSIYYIKSLVMSLKFNNYVFINITIDTFLSEKNVNLQLIILLV